MSHEFGLVIKNTSCCMLSAVWFLINTTRFSRFIHLIFKENKRDFFYIGLAIGVEMHPFQPEVISVDVHGGDEDDAGKKYIFARKLDEWQLLFHDHYCHDHSDHQCLVSPPVRQQRSSRRTGQIHLLKWNWIQLYRLVRNALFRAVWKSGRAWRAFDEIWIM